MVFPGGLTTNIYCGMCLECLRTCPHDNIAINLRPLGADLRPRRAPARRSLQEPAHARQRPGLRRSCCWDRRARCAAAAAAVGTPPWLAYAAGFLLITARPGPGALPVWRSGSDAWRARADLSPLESLRQICAGLVPLGLAAWAAFSLGFVLTNASYILPVLSDPSAWAGICWDASDSAWTPIGGRSLRGLLTAILLLGLAWSSRRARAVAERARRRRPLAIPFWGFSFLRLWGCYGSSSPDTASISRRPPWSWCWW